MVFEVPVEKRSKDQQLFKFSIEGVEYSATRFDLLPTEFLERVAELDEKRVLKALRLALAGDDESLASKLGALPIKSTTALIEAWQKNSGVSLGESLASAN